MNQGRLDWQKRGYIQCCGALSTSEVAAIKGKANQLYEHHRRNPKPPEIANTRDNTAMEDLHAYNVIKDSFFLQFIDHPSVFPLITSLMGNDIVLTQAQLIVRARNAEGTTFLHTDGGAALAAIRVREKSLPLMVKVQFALNDVRSDDAGNFQVIPGSHRLWRHETEQMGAIQLRLNAGDAVVFPHSLVHGHAVNQTEEKRYAFVLCYCQSFMKPFDFQRPTFKTLNTASPRQRYLLHETGVWKPGYGYYMPKDQERVMRGT